MAATSTRPKLPQLKTPVTSSFPKSATFPSELPSALSARTPISAFPEWRIKSEDGIKTPITPPVAYMDFLNKIASPIVSEIPPPFSRRTSNSNDDDTSSTTPSSPTITPFSEAPGSTSPASTPSTTESERCDCASTTTTAGVSSIKSPPTSAPTSFAYPSSAPPRDRRMHLRIPASATFAPTCPSIASPLSATPLSANPYSAAAYSSIASPYSARGSKRFDWDSALIPKTARPATTGKDGKDVAKRERERAMKDGKPEGKMSSKCGVRHVREVVTRTVTYQVAGAKGEESVRMSPAPRGKRRRLVSGVARRAGELKEEQ